MALARIALLSALPVAAALAHLEPGSLSSPEAGATYAPGTKVIAAWVQSQAHAGTYRFEFSRDGGATWDSAGSMRAPSGDGATVRFAWTVPDRPTARGRFKVCQPGGPCDDPDYVLESGDFSVRAGTSLGPARGPGAFAPAIRLLGDTRTLEITFALEAPADVVLEAFDAAGARIASLPQGRRERGRHALRLPGPPASGPLVLRLRAGGRIPAGTVIAPE